MSDVRCPHCRLCEGPVEHQFSKLVLAKYQVAYFRCLQCESLQTEQPYWLDEAYAGGNLGGLDTGAAQRNLNNLAAAWAVSKLGDYDAVLDFGGGDGLLCRLLRDYGVDCRVQDRHAVPTYARDYVAGEDYAAELLLSFEVFEHFANPAVDLAAVFAAGPRTVLATTENYDSQDASWWYLVPEAGQHVFFYSSKAMEHIATRFGYRFTAFGGYLLFSRDQRLFRRAPLLNVVLRRKTIKALRSFLALVSSDGSSRDLRAMRQGSM